MTARRPLGNHPRSDNSERSIRIPRNPVRRTDSPHPLLRIPRLGFKSALFIFGHGGFSGASSCKCSGGIPKRCVSMYVRWKIRKQPTPTIRADLSSRNFSSILTNREGKFALWTLGPARCAWKRVIKGLACYPRLDPRLDRICAPTS